MPVSRSSLFACLLLTAACSQPAASRSAADDEAASKVPSKAGHASALVPTPLDGLWNQASAACADGRVPTEAVEELDFGDAGFFSVTYSPFETYKDYWGRARFDLATGEIAFTQEGGNFVPPELDLKGRVELEGDRLTISEVWLGDRTHGAAAPPGCVYVFTRFRGGD